MVWLGTCKLVRRVSSTLRDCPIRDRHDMGKPIAIIQGHPDASGRHVCHALADEYAKGTEDGGYEVKRIDVARLDFPILRTKGEFEKGALPLLPGPAQEAISWADYLVLFRPQSQEPRAQHPGLLWYRPDQGKPHRHHRRDDRKTAGRLAG